MCRVVRQRHPCGVDSISNTTYCEESVTDEDTGERSTCGTTTWKEPEGITQKPCNVRTSSQSAAPTTAAKFASTKYANFAYRQGICGFQSDRFSGEQLNQRRDPFQKATLTNF
ncbi:hypothetical protein A9K55_004302 [Cordyceps militaris]|uniref:Uncharacterized protein n=1 Tax=Cordyceps militaris TaxID=73501 RepID=A0A2H4SLG4_CORMI|nr:hypothetical protein A9K55_004302 [Cordyceps militaris]